MAVPSIRVTRVAPGQKHSNYVFALDYSRIKKMKNMSISLPTYHQAFIPDMNLLSKDV